jgi:hypothetical protein
LGIDIKKYIKKIENKEHAFVPFGSDELIITLSARGMKDRFMQIKSFIEKQQTNLLCLNDPDNTWYLEQDKGESYNRLLSYYIKQFQPSNVTMLGSSMSGYGVLYHGIKFGNINIITSNPQVNYNETLRTCGPKLKQALLKIGGFPNIDDLYKQKKLECNIWYIYGTWYMDIVNFNLFMRGFPNKLKCIVEKTGIKGHYYYFNDVNEVYKRIKILQSLNNLSITTVGAGE